MRALGEMAIQNRSLAPSAGMRVIIWDRLQAI